MPTSTARSKSMVQRTASSTDEAIAGDVELLRRARVGRECDGERLNDRTANRTRYFDALSEAQRDKAIGEEARFRGARPRVGLARRLGEIRCFRPRIVLEVSGGEYSNDPRCAWRRHRLQQHLPRGCGRICIGPHRVPERLARRDFLVGELVLVRVGVNLVRINADPELLRLAGRGKTRFQANRQQHERQSGVQLREVVTNVAIDNDADAIGDASTRIVQSRRP